LTEVRAGASCIDRAGRGLAPAKINLCLHVVGRRADGLHELDSLVAFADVGDEVHVSLGRQGVELDVDSASPFAGSVPRGEAGLVVRAVRMFLALTGCREGVNVRMRCLLPSGAGLGGASSAAAVVLRILRRRLAPDLAPGRLAKAAFALGADLPVCLLRRPARVRGAGEWVEPVRLPAFACVLLWPGRPLSTERAFAAFRDAGRFGAPLPRLPERISGPVELGRWLRGSRNDLAAMSERLQPGLSALRDRLMDEGALHAAMTGSGSAHWGLFADRQAAGRAVARIRAARPDWWCRAAFVADRPTEP